MQHIISMVEEIRQMLSPFIKKAPVAAIITGTGTNSLDAMMDDYIEIPYSTIPHMASTTVESHKGTLVYGNISGKPVLVFSGRFHYYEGADLTRVTLPVRIASAFGIPHLIMTNAAGGVNPHFEEGDVVLVSDHINLMPGNPLRGENDARLGVRFPDMLNAYDVRLRNVFHHLAGELNISLKSGVYLALQGPSLETPAEYRMVRILGADLVGMSTVPEVIAARHAKLKVTVFSVVSNVCFPEARLSETTVEDVIKVVSQSSTKIEQLLQRYFSTLN
ncbi:MAG: purine-nucleoside phosphorylase [Saprospiraceae bacterium]|nr:purine-nucleoside phosphorylase [Saprospiraceae bacterium]